MVCMSLRYPTAAALLLLASGVAEAVEVLGRGALHSQPVVRRELGADPPPEEKLEAQDKEEVSTTTAVTSTTASEVPTTTTASTVVTTSESSTSSTPRPIPSGVRRRSYPQAPPHTASQNGATGRGAESRGPFVKVSTQEVVESAKRECWWYVARDVFSAVCVPILCVGTILGCCFLKLRTTASSSIHIHADDEQPPPANQDSEEGCRGSTDSLPMIEKVATMRSDQASSLDR